MARVLGELRFSNATVNLNEAKACLAQGTRYVCIDLMLCVRLAGAHLPAQLPLLARLRVDSGPHRAASRAFLRPVHWLGAAQTLGAGGQSLSFTAPVATGAQLACHPPIPLLIRVSTRAN